jgi:hypothetical protein
MTPRLRFNAVEPGYNPATDLSRDAPVAVRFLLKYVLAPLAPFIRYWSTLGRAGKVIASVLLNESGTGVYYDERGKPMLATDGPTGLIRSEMSEKSSWGMVKSPRRNGSPQWLGSLTKES